MLVSLGEALLSIGVRSFVNTSTASYAVSLPVWRSQGRYILASEETYRKVRLIISDWTLSIRFSCEHTLSPHVSVVLLNFSVVVGSHWRPLGENPRAAVNHWPSQGSIQRMPSWTQRERNLQGLLLFIVHMNGLVEEITNALGSLFLQIKRKFVECVDTDAVRPIPILSSSKRRWIFF